MTVFSLPRTLRSAMHGIWRFYADGFRSMTIGRTLWAIIVIKLIVIFVVLRLLFFPDVVRRESHGDGASYVAGQLTGR